MQPSKPTQPAATAAIAIEDSDQELNATVRNTQEQPQTNHGAAGQAPSTSAAGAASSEQAPPADGEPDIFSVLERLKSQQRPAPPSTTGQAASGAAAQATERTTRWVTHGTLTVSQCVVGQQDLLLEEKSIITTTDPKKRHTLFLHLHGVLTENLTDTPTSTDDLRDFLQPPAAASLSFLTTLQVTLAALQGCDGAISDTLRETLQEPIAAGISLQMLLDRTAQGGKNRRRFLQVLAALTPQQQQSAIACFSKGFLSLKQAFITAFATMTTPAPEPAGAAIAPSVWSALREHSLLPPLDHDIEEAHLQQSLQDLQCYIDKKAQRGEPLSAKVQSGLQRATRAMHETRCMFNYIRANGYETYPTPQQGEIACKAVRKARALHIISQRSAELAGSSTRMWAVDARPLIEMALTCMFNAGACPEYAEMTNLMLAKVLQEQEYTCIKTVGEEVNEEEHTVALLVISDPEAAQKDDEDDEDDEVCIVADSWNLGHAILFEDSTHKDKELSSSTLSLLRGPVPDDKQALGEDACEHVTKVESILQQMISGQLTIEGKTMQEHLQEFRTQYREQDTGQPRYLTPENVLAEEFR